MNMDEQIKNITIKEYLEFIDNIPSIYLKNKEVFFTIKSNTKPEIKELQNERLRLKNPFYKSYFILTEIFGNRQFCDVSLSKLHPDALFKTFLKLYETIKNEETIELFVHQPFIAQPDIFRRIRKMPSLNEVAMLKQLEILIKTIKKIYLPIKKEPIKIFLINEADFENDIIPEWTNNYIKKFNRILKSWIKIFGLTKNVKLISCRSCIFGRSKLSLKKLIEKHNKGLVNPIKGYVNKGKWSPELSIVTSISHYTNFLKFCDPKIIRIKDVLEVFDIIREEFTEGINVNKKVQNLNEKERTFYKKLRDYSLNIAKIYFSRSKLEGKTEGYKQYFGDNAIPFSYLTRKNKLSLYQIDRFNKNVASQGEAIANLKEDFLSSINIKRFLDLFYLIRQKQVIGVKVESLQEGDDHPLFYILYNNQAKT